MKYILLFNILLIIVSCTKSDGNSSPSADKSSSLWEGIRQLGVSASSILPYTSTIDSFGNIYVAGRAYSGFDGNIQTGNVDFFITKFDSSAKKIWTRQLGCSNHMTIANTIKIDKSGNILISGYTQCGLDGNTLHGNTDSFVTKYTNDGIKIWTKQIGGIGGTVQAYGLAIDSSNSIYLSGDTDISYDGNTKISPISYMDAFITKFDQSGNKQWSKQIGSISLSTDFSQISIDASNNIFISGNQGNGFYIEKLNSYGVQVWKHSTLDSISPPFFTSIQTDSDGNIYVSSVSNGGIDGNSAIGTLDSIITKFNSSGVKQWTNQFGVTGKETFVYQVNTDSNKSVILLGFVNGGLDSNILTGTKDCFLSKFNSSGVKQWTKQLGVAGVDTKGTASSIDSEGNIYISGYTFGAMPGNLLTGIADLFIAKYTSIGVLQ